MVIVATCDDVMSPKTVATEGHNNNRLFGDIMEEVL
jgi:hypothetical protein